MDVKSKYYRQFIRSLSKLGLSSASDISRTNEFAIQDLIEALEAGMYSHASDMSGASALNTYVGSVEGMDSILSRVVFDMNNIKMPND